MEETIYNTKYAVLSSLEDYQALNTKIGIAKNYPDDKSDTYFYSEPEPLAIDGLYYMKISEEIQQYFPLVLDNIVLIDLMPEIIENTIEIIDSITENE